jgi:hypothetical protein
MNKLLVLIAAVLAPACTVRVYETPPTAYGYNQYGYGQSYGYGYYPGTGVSPVPAGYHRTGYRPYQGPFPPRSTNAEFMASGCTNLNPNVCAARGW